MAADIFRDANHTFASHSNFTSIGQSHIYNPSVNVHGSFADEGTTVLAGLKPVECSGGYDVSRCTEGTRQWMLDQIYSWLRDIEAPNILLLSGSPGAGKSTIAYTLASQLQAEGLLGCGFFCKQDDVTLSDPTIIWRTVAFNLAKRDTHFADRVIQNLKAERVDPMRTDIGLHFDTLIKDPAAWASAKYTQAQGRDVVEVHETHFGVTGVISSAQSTGIRFPVVILDALDECGSDSSQSTQRRMFMNTITKWLHMHPMFKLVITSRDQDLPPALRDACHHIILQTGDLVSAHSNLDIKRFFEKRLAEIGSWYPSLQSWPGESIIKQLTDRAAGLFIWAQTVVSFLDKHRGFHDEQLELVLGGSFHEEGNALDKLYNKILLFAFKDYPAQVLQTFKYVIGAILLAKVPLHLHDLYHLLGWLKKSSIDFILNLVSSVISDWRGDRPIHINHLSFLEFMCDPKRCPETFFINHRTHSQMMALACFRVMNAGLRFNICGIESSCYPNDEIEDLAPRIKQAIPSHLSYSCLFGAEHLQSSAFDSNILEEVKTFIYTGFLFWLEVLSLLQEAKRASRALLLIRHWSSNHDEEIVVFSRDASKFVAAFMSVISYSAPHIYLSALPFAPIESKVSQRFLPQFPQMMSIEAGKATHWPAIQHVLRGLHFRCVAFSQNGEYIASGSDCGYITVWDVDTGAVISGPFKCDGGCEFGPILSITFSQDGRHVVSCAYNGTICISEVETEEIISEQRWHESHVQVMCIACSWDGKRVVSCSEDGEIIICDVELKAVVAGPFQIHEGRVTSVAWSWDARCIVLAYGDGSICVYDVEMKTVVFDTVERHAVGKVECLAVSPDGHNIVSASYKQICIWDGETGVMKFQRPKSDSVSVGAAFSPDSRRLISAAIDVPRHSGDIDIWEVDMGATGSASATFYGHTDPIFSIAFSLDGQRVVSCSYGMICIWDVTGGETSPSESDPEQGHAGTIRSVAFSQDREYVISASLDCTVCIWNAETGVLVTEPLDHAAWSVTFSEDGENFILCEKDDKITILNVDTGIIVSSKSAPGGFSIHPDGVLQDGKRAVVHSTTDDKIWIWNTEMEAVTSGPFDGRSNYVVALSPDGKRCASGICDRQSIYIWEADTGAVISGLSVGGLEGIIMSIAFSWDGKLVVTASMDMICTWHVETGTIASGPFKTSCQCQGANYLTEVAFSPNSKHIVWCSSNFNTIHILDTEAGDVVSRPFQGHTDKITSIAFSGDGKRLVSGSDDSTIRIWDLETKEATLPIKSDAFLGAFTDNSEMTEDGWVLGPHEELLFWVPPLHRTGLWRPSNTAVIGRHATKIDFSRFVYGTSWALCKSGVI